jgi:hypothetical protein
MPAGEVTVRLNLNKDGYSAGMTAARKEAQVLADAVEKTGHSTVSSMQATSAAIRGIDMSSNIRAAERFLSMIPGVGKALQAIFPLFGAAAVAGVFMKMGEEVAKAIHTMQQIPAVAHEGFLAITDGAQKSADGLRVSNDKLEEQIAVLEHKPVNNLALALDEARVAADNLAGSLGKDYEQFKKVIEESQKGILNTMLGGGVNKTLGNDMLDRLANIRELAREQRAAMSSGDLAKQQSAALGHGDTAKAAELGAQIKASQAKADDLGRKLRAAEDASMAFANSMTAPIGPTNQRSGIRGPYAPVQQGVTFDALKQFGELVQDREDEQDQQKEGVTGQGQLKKDEENKRAQAAMKAAQEALVQQWHKDLDEQKAEHDMTLADDARFWLQRVETNVRGAKTLVGALAAAQGMDEANKVIGQMRGENMRSQKEFDKTSTGAYAPDSMDLSKGDTGAEKNQGRETAEWLKTLNEGISQRRADANAIAEQSLQMEVLTGRMSKLGEAQALAALHAQAFADAQDRIDDALANAQKLPGGPDKKRTIEGLQDQSAHVGAQAQMQAVQDQYATSQQQIWPAAKTALDQMVQSFTDLAANLKDVIPKAMNSLNDDLVKGMLGHAKARDFGQTFSQAGQGLMKTGLQGAEGKIMGAFGLGKRDGSSQLAALWVQVAASTAGLSTSSPSVSAGVDSLAKLIPGGSFIQPFLGGQQAQGGGGGGILGNLLHSFLPSLLKGGGGGVGGSAGAGLGDIGIFGGGGDFLANHPMIVGDMGPELINPGFSGHVTPNNQLGGGGDTHINVDARGSNDPAAIEAAVRRSAPHIIAAGMQASHAAKARSPHGR